MLKAWVQHPAKPFRRLQRQALAMLLLKAIILMFFKAWLHRVCPHNSLPVYLHSVKFKALALEHAAKVLK